MNLVNGLNLLWMLKSRPELNAFHRSTRAVAETQQHLLRAMLRRNRDTIIGRRFGFANIRSVREYQAQVPIVSYSECVPEIDRIANGERKILTRERVLLLEPTGGSTSGEKLIPYTTSLRRQYHKAIAAWIADLYQHRPAVRNGKAYWSISPAHVQDRRSRGGIPIGFDDDSSYLGGLERWAFRRITAVHPHVARVHDSRLFRYVTLLCLLATEDLSLISIWSPTFLTRLIQAIPESVDRICFDLAKGKICGSDDEALAGCSQLATFQPNPDRAARLRKIWSDRSPMADRLAETWPCLALLSCWSDGSSFAYAQQLRRLFPHVEFQPKGLLATEGVVSFPLANHTGSATAIRSHFFEFLPSDETQTPQLAHELQVGNRYRVIITTGGGLYRYDLGDLIEVVGHLHACPLVRFVGRAGSQSDLVGEKLTETHVQQTVEQALVMAGLRATCSVLMPVADDPPRYRLLVQFADGKCDASEREKLLSSLENGLCQNPGYRWARELHQLGQVEVHIVASDALPLWDQYEQVCLRRGARLGDIKPVSLYPRTDWPDSTLAAPTSPLPLP